MVILAVEVRELILAMPRSSHAHPFRQIDRPGAAGPDRCVSTKLVGADEVLRDDGDPGVYPPVLVVEALAQAALPLAGAGGGSGAAGGPAPRSIVPRRRAPRRTAPRDTSPAAIEGIPGMIVAMDRVRLHRRVRAGDRLSLTAVVVARLGGLIRVASRAEVEGTVVAEGEFTFATGAAPGETR